MQDRGDKPTETGLATPKAEWVKPEIASKTPISAARGNGGVGFDFASEAS